MVQGIDRLIIAVADLATASREYAALLDEPACQREDEAWFVLANTTVVLRQEPGQQGRILGLALADVDAPEEPEVLDNALGLLLERVHPDATASLRREQAPTRRVDHVVLRTRDAEACIAMFERQLGMRLALDKTVPEWGGRMLFFRSGKLTLEVIESAQKAPSRDYFWGVAYECGDLPREAERLVQAGVALSELREGRKPGTRVATLKSHDLGVQTLLIEPAPR